MTFQRMFNNKMDCEKYEIIYQMKLLEKKYPHTDFDCSWWSFDVHQKSIQELQTAYNQMLNVVREEKAHRYIRNLFVNLPN